MTDTVLTARSAQAPVADRALRASAALWFLVAVFGQLFFAYYIMVFYGGTAMSGDWEAWARRLIHGIIEGDPLGNLAVILHLVLAFIITVGGPLQFVPKIRQSAPAFHRWNGRVYIVTAIVISLGTLYMVWTRGILGGLANEIAISLNGLAIMICAGMTIRHALARDIATHYRWALRTFLMVSGVWFFRIGFGLWIFLNNGSAPGSNQTLTGPFDLSLAFGQTLVPLMVVELYFRARKRGNSLGKIAMATGLAVCAAGTGVGIFMAAHIFWLPNL